MPWWWKEYPERDIEPVNYYPVEISPIPWTAVWSDTMRTRRDHLGLYVHVPVCSGICSFCLFSRSVADPERVELYVEAVCDEIRLYGAMAGVGGLPVPFLLFGGGTPSVLSAGQFAAILGALRRYFDLDGCQISVEAHPGTVDRAFLEGVRALGVHRVTFGVQSFQPVYLDRIGSRHTPAQSHAAVALARQAGFDSVGIDLMYALPGEGAEDWQQDLRSALEVGPDHISVYRLFLDPGGYLAYMIQKGLRPALPTPLQEEEMALACFDMLEPAGYRHYRSQSSLSFDLALPGHESRYEIMHDGAPQSEYLALGPGAFGFANGFLYCNIHTLPEWAAEVHAGLPPVLAGRLLTLEDQMSRFMVLGMKELAVDKAAFRRQFAQDVDTVFAGALAKLTAFGLIEVTDTQICVTQKGRTYADNICKAFYSVTDYRLPQPPLRTLEYWSRHLFNPQREQGGSS